MKSKVTVMYSRFGSTDHAATGTAGYVRLSDRRDVEPNRVRRRPD